MLLHDVQQFRQIKAVTVHTAAKLGPITWADNMAHGSSNKEVSHHRGQWKQELVSNTCVRSKKYFTQSPYFVDPMQSLLTKTHLLMCMSRASVQSSPHPEAFCT